jgi:predicted Zn-dependent protease
MRVSLKSYGFIFSLVVIAALFVFTYIPSLNWAKTTQTVPCQEPLTYRFGDIDPRFDIPQEELKHLMKEVETLWASAMKQQLLEYDKDGQVVINLVYSEDQQRTEDERRLYKRIQLKKGQVNVLEQEYAHQKKRFEQNQELFSRTLSNFNQQVKKYNDWQKRMKTRSIPFDIRQKFKQLERKINQLKVEVERRKENLEFERQKTNNKLRQLNRFIDQQNKLISQYNMRFGVAKKFNQGQYVKKGQDEQINIYQFANLAELKTVLAHETGHALGLSHVNNPEAIMNALMDKQNIFNLSLTNEDITAIKNKCSTIAGTSGRTYN